METIAHVPPVQWLAVPATAALLWGRPLLAALLTVLAYGCYVASVLLWWHWEAGEGAGVDGLLWELVQRALYVAAALVATGPAAVAKGHRLRNGHHLHLDGWQAFRGAGAGAQGARQGSATSLLLVLLAVAACFTAGTWGERAEPLWDARSATGAAGWRMPVGRLSSVLLFLALALVVRHLRRLDTGPATLWMLVVALGALMPGGFSALILVAALTALFLFSATWRGW